MAVGEVGRASAPLAVVVITRDEEPNIERCLRSVAWAAERIVVDAHSGDRTAELARACGARVIQRAWPGYARQKNFAIEQARQPWILSLDADEEVSPALAAQMQSALAGDPPHAAYRVFVPTYFLGSWLRHYGRARRDPGHVRLFRRGRARFEDRVVHECLLVDGAIGTLRAPVYHYCYRPPSLRSYWGKIHYYANLEAADRLAANSRSGNRWARGLGKFAWMMLWRGGLLDGPPAWVWIAGQAYQEFLVTGAVRRRRRAEKMVRGTA
jgi:glycosyltransferase involved in cell wall biosynthesis